MPLRKKLTFKEKTKQLLDLLLEKHNNVAKLINEVILPNLQGLAKLNKLFADHVILMYIIKRKLQITDEEYQATKARLYDVAAQNAQPSGVQSEKARTDEDRGPDGQPGVLDAPIGGDDPESGGVVPVREHGRGSGEAAGPTEPEHPAAGVGADEIIVMKKPATLGVSECRNPKRIIMTKARQMSQSKLQKEMLDYHNKKGEA